MARSVYIGSLILLVSIYLSIFVFKYFRTLEPYVDRLFDQQTSLCPVDFDASCDVSDVTCEGFECPDNYSLIDDYLTTVCMDSGCTKHLCCVKEGELLAVINMALALYRVDSCSQGITPC